MTALGVYYAPEHSRQSDRDYIQKLQPRVIRLLDPDVQQIADMHALVPSAIVAPRMWTIDDNNGQAVRDLMADPVGTGKRHAQQFRALWDEWTRQAAERGLRLPSVSNILFSSANEPNQGGTPDKIAAYSIAFMDACTELGLRACAPCLGVGWPDNTGTDTPVDWSPYAGLDKAIKRNGGFLEVHEYFYDDGPQNMWRWWAGRHLQCPFDVPILLGEIGIDNFVDAARWHNEGGNRGWQGNVSPDTYAEQIEWHISHSDTRVYCALIFVTDFRNREWSSFDTNPAHGALLARKDKMWPRTSPSIPVVPTTPPVTTHLPSVGNATTPTQTPQGDNWQRAIEWVLKWEGGFQNNPADTGNYYNGQLIGTKYGISAASWGGQYDIPNLTLEQAKRIYFEHYWRASGADKLAWPYSLFVFDTAVLHGVGTAQKWVNEVGNNPYAFAAKRLRTYTKLGNWDEFGAGWVNRTADLLEEAAK